MKFSRLISSLLIPSSLLILSACKSNGVGVPKDAPATGGGIPPVAEATPTSTPTPMPDPEEPVCEIWEIGSAQGRFCSDGSYDVYSSLDLVSAITWNPEVRIPDGVELKWRVRFELPSRLEVRTNDQSASGDGWTQFDVDGIRYCYQASGNPKSNEAPEFVYAAKVGEFTVDEKKKNDKSSELVSAVAIAVEKSDSKSGCAELRKQTDTHLDVKPGEVITAEESLNLTVTSGTSFSKKEISSLSIALSLKLIGVENK